MLISADLLRQIGVRAPEPWAGPLSTACAAQGITTPQRLAAFLANILLETRMLSALVENLDYTPEALLTQWPQHFPAAAAQALGRVAGRAADQQGIAELAYGGRYGNANPGSGDGWLFRGRGCMMHTFRANYVTLASAIGWRGAVEALPAWLETVPGACASAGLYWGAHGCNVLADQGDVAGVRQRINGGTIGLGVVTALYRSVLAAIRAQDGGAASSPASAPVAAASTPTPTPALPPVLVQPSGLKVLPVPPVAVAPRPVMSDAAERLVTDQLNEQSLSDALNQRPRP